MRPSPAQPLTTIPRAMPRLCSTLAIGSVSSARGTPMSWAVGLAGLSNGPKKLNRVR